MSVHTKLAATPENANRRDLIADRWGILLLMAFFFDTTRFEYSLTDKGKPLFPFVMVLHQWRQRHSAPRSA